MSRTSIKVYSEMGLLNLPLVVLLCCVFCLLSSIALCEDSVVTVKFLKAPHAFSHLNSATFFFEVLVGGNVACTNSNITCKLDDGIASNCEGRTDLYAGLQDGNHTFEVCTNGSQGVGCVNPVLDLLVEEVLYARLFWSMVLAKLYHPHSTFYSQTFNILSLWVYHPLLSAQYGRVILVMDKNFCTDSAGNKFTRNQNSTFNVHFDRRSMFVNFTTHVPERLLQLNGETRLGTLLPLAVSKQHPGHRRFEYKAATCISGMAIVTVNINSTIICISGTPVSQVEPITFIYGCFLLIHINVTFRYSEAYCNVEYTTLRISEACYHVPKISSVVSVLATASFVVTSIAAGLLTVSIASLSSIGTFSTPFSSFSNPASNLFRSACHIQVFALSRWLAVRLPVNYYEFARGLQWSIPYFSLPWETGHIQPVVVGSSPPTNSDSYRSKIHDSGIFLGVQPKQENLSRVASVYKARLRPNPKEYISYFQNNSKLDAEYILDGWEDFSRTMFWLAIIGGSLILLHALLLAILKFRKQKQRGYGLLTFPRFEIFLFLSTGITFAKLLQYNEDLQVGRIFNNPRNRGQWTWKIEWNFDCLTILEPLFEDIRGPMLSQKIYGESIDTHGDGIIASNEEIEELCPKDEERSDTAATLINSLTFSTSLHTHGDDGIISSNDETEDLCPKDEEVSGDNVARTHDSAPRSSVRSTSSSNKSSRIPLKRSNTTETLVDSLTSSIIFHTHGDNGIIASDDETEDLFQKAEEVSRDNVVRTSGTRLDSAPRSSMRSTSHSTRPSHIPSKRLDTITSLIDSLTSDTSFHTHGDDGIIASNNKTEDLCPKAKEVSGDNVVRTLGTRLNLAPQNLVRSTSGSTRLSHIPSKRSDTAATLIDSLMSNTSFHTHGDDGIIASNDKIEDLCPKA
ncbi:hypothetical protein CMV_012822 [Castanea mollissima]|uniref:Uncharacterized protein n=1 Tax=Castanea mollissima TaxID=60419 RepID=A0A8J4REV8_9ROSI|nr:hypothetical protein CMV_012822 [Castanea mollissima]